MIYVYINIYMYKNKDIDRVDNRPPPQYLLYVGYAVYLWDRALAHSPSALLAALRFFVRPNPQTLNTNR